MLLIIGLVLSTIFLSWPSRLLVIIPLALIEGFELMMWLKWRKVRSVTGAEGIIGLRGKSLTDCRPTGHVKVKGQIWKARCTIGVLKDQDVVVTNVNGLLLEVDPVREQAQEAQSAQEKLAGHSRAAGR